MDHAAYGWRRVTAVAVSREKVRAHFQAKADASACPKERQACRTRTMMALYKKGDTRMLSIFKLLFRTKLVRVKAYDILLIIVLACNTVDARK